MLALVAIYCYRSKYIFWITLFASCHHFVLIFFSCTQKQTHTQTLFHFNVFHFTILRKIFMNAFFLMKSVGLHIYQQENAPCFSFTNRNMTQGKKLFVLNNFQIYNFEIMAFFNTFFSLSVCLIRNRFVYYISSRLASMYEQQLFRISN